MKKTLGDAVSDVRASDRLTGSAACLVAPEHGMDRQIEKLLAGAGRLGTATKPIFEINPHHPLIEKLSEGEWGDEEIREDAAYLLFDEARIADGELPLDSRAFCPPNTSARSWTERDRLTDEPRRACDKSIPVPGHDQQQTADTGGRLLVLVFD